MKNILKQIKYFLWDKPTAKPPKEAPIRVKAEQVFDEYMVIEYRGQKINLRKSELAKWNAMGRHDKRGMSERFKNLEKKKLIRFENINGKWTCLKNKLYGNEGIHS